MYDVAEIVRRARELGLAPVLEELRELDAPLRSHCLHVQQALARDGHLFPIHGRMSALCRRIAFALEPAKPEAEALARWLLLHSGELAAAGVSAAGAAAAAAPITEGAAAVDRPAPAPASEPLASCRRLYREILSPPRDNEPRAQDFQRSLAALQELLRREAACLPEEELERIAALQDVSKDVMYYLEGDPLYDAGHDHVGADYRALRRLATQELQRRAKLRPTIGREPTDPPSDSALRP